MLAHKKNIRKELYEKKEFERISGLTTKNGGKQCWKKILKQTKEINEKYNAKKIHGWEDAVLKNLESTHQNHPSNFVAFTSALSWSMVEN